MLLAQGLATEGTRIGEQNQSCLIRVSSVANFEGCEIMGLIAEVVGNRWQPGIGDPTLLGWLTVVAYALTCGLCVLAFRAAEARARSAGGEELLWASLSVMMLALGINKQLDLQTWVTQVGRDFVTGWGLYAWHQVYQAMFILVVAVGGLAAVGVLWRLAIDRRWPLTPLAGATFLAVYVVIRAASFHHIDQILNLDIPGARLSSVIEVAGIAIIAVSAAQALRPHPRPPEPNPNPLSLLEIVNKFR